MLFIHPALAADYVGHTTKILHFQIEIHLLIYVLLGNQVRMRNPCVSIEQGLVQLRGTGFQL